ncbi:MAG TPA: ABC transporter ATP-binding protein [Terrimesophilobacter sp.]|nr:ABC transporter ATP-binding protein [Terrimesophilobacter sp.]HRP99023.1 ABC transporter ATP-binding protein [Terrimesophilobacter sp.]
MSEYPLLEFDNVSLEFPATGELVLRDVSLTINDGEFVAIVGPSGSGKTTFLRLAHGLLHPTAGQIRMSGERVIKPNRERAFVFQADSLLPWRSILDNVAYPAEIAGKKRSVAREMAEPFVELVGLAAYKSSYPAQLSGGMRQRVNLARALSANPRILLMDEPFGALDAQTREVMQDELLRIWQAQRKTVLFVTHQLDEAVFLADRVIVLGAHPGFIKKDITIEIDRPRALEAKRTAKFNKYVEEIWELIKTDVFVDRSN